MRVTNDVPFVAFRLSIVINPDAVRGCLLCVVCLRDSYRQQSAVRGFPALAHTMCVTNDVSSVAFNIFNRNSS